MSENKETSTIEEEISKQIDNLDHRFDRNGWFFIVVLVIILFMLVYIFMQLRGPESKVEFTEEEIFEKFESIDQELSFYEERIAELENQE